MAKSKVIGISTIPLEGYHDSFLDESGLLPISADTFPYSPAPSFDPWYSSPVPFPTDEIVPLPAPSPNNPIEFNRNLYIDGTIYDNKNIPLEGVTIFIIDKTGKRLTEPFLLPDPTYSAWTDQDPFTMSVVFQKKGFKEQIVLFSTLQYNSDVTMQPGDSTSKFPILPIAVLTGLILLYKKKKSKKVGAFNFAELSPLLLLAAGILSYVLIEKILQKFGLMGSKKQKNEQTNPNSAFKPDYWRQFDFYTYAITESQAGAYSKTIHNAFSVFQDDYSQILNVFKNLRTKANVSFLAWKFQKEYKEDLLNFLSDGGGVLPWDGLSTIHMDEIINLVNTYPDN